MQQHLRILSVMMLTLVSIFAFTKTASAEDAPKKITYETKKDIYYLDVEEEKADDYMKSQCRLDIYWPNELKDCPVVIWLHGGGLTGGKKSIPGELKNREMVIVGVEYRLSPNVKCPTYFDDVAAAIAWTFKHVKEYNGDPDKIYVSGHSAGGYLTAMVGCDPQWLGKYGMKPQQLAGLAPLSGMMTTHFRVRAERGDENWKRPWVDEYSPMQHLSADLPPMLLVTGDRLKDWPGRMEENQLMARMLTVLGHKDVTMKELGGWGHGMVSAGMPVVVWWIQDHEKAAQQAKDAKAAEAVKAANDDTATTASDTSK